MDLDFERQVEVTETGKKKRSKDRKDKRVENEGPPKIPTLGGQKEKSINFTEYLSR